MTQQPSKWLAISFLGCQGSHKAVQTRHARPLLETTVDTLRDINIATKQRPELVYTLVLHLELSLHQQYLIKTAATCLNTSWAHTTQPDSALSQHTLNTLQRQKGVLPKHILNKVIFFLPFFFYILNTHYTTRGISCLNIFWSNMHSNTNVLSKHALNTLHKLEDVLSKHILNTHHTTRGISCQNIFWSSIHSQADVLSKHTLNTLQRQEGVLPKHILNTHYTTRKISCLNIFWPNIYSQTNVLSQHTMNTVKRQAGVLPEHILNTQNTTTGMSCLNKFWPNIQSQTKVLFQHILTHTTQHQHPVLMHSTRLCQCLVLESSSNT